MELLIDKLNKDIAELNVDLARCYHVYRFYYLMQRLANIADHHQQKAYEIIQEIESSGSK